MKGLSLWYGIILLLLGAVVYMLASGRKKNIKQPANDTKGKYKLAAIPDLSGILNSRLKSVFHSEKPIALPKDNTVAVAKKEFSELKKEYPLTPKEKPAVDPKELRGDDRSVVAKPLSKLDKDTVLIKNTQVVSPKIDRSVALVGTKKVDDDAMVRAAKIEYSKLNKEKRMQ